MRAGFLEKPCVDRMRPSDVKGVFPCLSPRERTRKEKVRFLKKRELSTIINNIRFSHSLKN
jgi:hypothetical protein